MVSTNTGYSRSYGTYPYGDYRTNHNNLIFPVSDRDGRLPAKQRVLGVLLANTTKAYPIAAFGNGVSLIQESLDNTAVVIAGSEEHNFAVAFERQVNGQVLSFEALNDQLPLIMKDEAGNTWNIWGQAVDGPNKGATLKPLNSYIAYWFAWAAFWPGTDLSK